MKSLLRKYAWVRVTLAVFVLLVFLAVAAMPLAVVATVVLAFVCLIAWLALYEVITDWTNT